MIANEFFLFHIEFDMVETNRRVLNKGRFVEALPASCIFHSCCKFQFSFIMRYTGLPTKRQYCLVTLASPWQPMTVLERTKSRYNDIITVEQWFTNIGVKWQVIYLGTYTVCAVLQPVWYCQVLVVSNAATNIFSIRKIFLSQINRRASEIMRRVYIFIS